MPATLEQLERRISRLERELQAARGIGTTVKMRNKVDHGGHQIEHVAAPLADNDAIIRGGSTSTSSTGASGQTADALAFAWMF